MAQLFRDICVCVCVCVLLLLARKSCTIDGYLMVNESNARLFFEIVQTWLVVTLLTSYMYISACVCMCVCVCARARACSCMYTYAGTSRVLRFEKRIAFQRSLGSKYVRLNMPLYLEYLSSVKHTISPL